MIEIDEHHGDGDIWISNGQIHFDCEGFTDFDLRKFMAAVRDAEDAEYITVKSRHDSVRVAKRDGYLIVKIEEPGEKVDIKLRLEVVAALIEDDAQEMDLVAMVRALSEHTDGDLIRVDGEDEQVRIWIDNKSDSD